MRAFRFDLVLLADGWARDVHMSVDAAGAITSIGKDAADIPAERVAGITIPGMPNAHSHAFQRAMCGDAESSEGEHGSFWSWRERMYTLANGIDAAGLEIVASQLYVELLEAGYTSVAEFHYLHRAPRGAEFAVGNPMLTALISAARGAGIGLCLVPAAYHASGFGGVPLREEQRRFEADAQFVAARLAWLSRELQGDPLIGYAAAFHSLRAVTPGTLRDLAREVRARHPNMPIHLHVAEQQGEVDACLAHTEMRPIEWLLHSQLLDEHWCLVHATHANAVELEAVAKIGCTVCLCPTTEANLGDGHFDTRNFLEHRGRFAIGSDSQVGVDPFEELRWLEYQQRLEREQRSVLEPRRRSLGESLWRSACAGGAAALGAPIGVLREGARADWLVFDADHPALAGANQSTLLDRIVFAQGGRALADVAVAGRWVVRGGLHRNREAVAARYVEWRRANGPG